MVAEYDQGLCQASADMLLGEVYYACVGTSQITRKLVYEKPGEFVVFIDHVLYQCHRQRAHYRGFKSGSRRIVTFFGKICAIAEILH